MTVRVALVGCGAIARSSHLVGLRDAGAEVVVFASRSASSAEKACADWGSGDVTTDWRAAVARDDVDAVHVCTPNALHAEVAAAALRAGKHVLVEKPMATTLADADELLSLAGDRVVGVAFDARCHPLLAELRRRVPALGTVRHVTASLGHGGPQLWSPDAGWFRDPALSGGGCLMDLGVHVVDAVRWCVAPVEAVTGAELAGPVDEQAELQLRLVGGATAEVSVSWQLPEPAFAFRVEGDGGVLEVVGEELFLDGVAVAAPPAAHRNAAAAFAHALAAGTSPVADGTDGRAALAVVLAGYESARTAQEVVVA